MRTKSGLEKKYGSARPRPTAIRQMPDNLGASTRENVKNQVGACWIESATGELIPAKT